MTIHERVLDAALRLCREGGGWTFNSRDVVAALADLNPGSVRTHVMSRCCVNAPANHPHRWSYFRRVRRGVYQLLPAWRRGAAHGARTAAPAARIIHPPPAGEMVVMVRESGAGYVADIPGTPETMRAASLGEVVDLARRAGQSGALLLRLEPGAEQPDPVVAVYMRDIDRTLVRQSLRMTHEERLAVLQDWMNATGEARGAAGRAAAGTGATARRRRRRAP